MPRRFGLWALAAAAVLWAAPSVAQEFFAGKTITMVAGFPPGGGVDTEMRLISRHLPRFIPGNPSIVNMNMPGAGGIVAANHIYRAAPDGLTLGMPSRGSLLVSGAQKEQGIAFDIYKLGYIGSAGGGSWALWVAKRTGVSTVAELKASKKEIVIGGLAPGTQNVVVPTVLAKQGWPLKVLPGYPGTSENLVALERGETDGLYHEGATIKTVRPDWMKTGFLLPIVQTHKEYPNVPLIGDTVEDPNVKGLLNLYGALNRLGLILMGPPGIPADRLEVLRKAFVAMVSDKEFVAEAESRNLPAGPAVNGGAIETLVHDLFTTLPPQVLVEYNALTNTK
jgi:hypothetical protein